MMLGRLEYLLQMIGRFHETDLDQTGVGRKTEVGIKKLE